jgi:aminopeptidase N
MTKILRLPIVTFLLVATSGAGAAPVVGHMIDMRLNPQDGSRQASDQLVLPGGRSLWSFSLHGGLHPQIVSGSGRLQRLGSDGELERFRLEVAEQGPLTLRYGGRIQHTLEAIQESLGRARQWSPGTIIDQGVVLDAESG